MAALKLLPGERIEQELRPHPLGFLSRFIAAASPAMVAGLLAWLFTTSWWSSGSEGRFFEVWTWLYGNTYAAYVYAVAAMALVGIIVAIVAIRWSYFAWFLLVGLGAVGLTIWMARQGSQATTILPLMLAVFAVPGLLFVEASRRSHRYHLTNLRIVFRGGLAIQKERQMRYEAITDLDGSQGLLGRMLDYGTLIPVTQSGFGLGDDRAGAGMGAAAGAQKGGIMGGLGGAAGGSRGVQVGRARSFPQPPSIRPYGDTKHLLESLIAQATSTPYLREQVELQRKMLEALERRQDSRDG
jgi:hypothetical protein